MTVTLLVDAEIGLGNYREWDFESVLEVWKVELCLTRKAVDPK